LKREALHSQLKGLEATFNVAEKSCLDRLATVDLRVRFDYLVRLEVMRAGVRLTPDLLIPPPDKDRKIKLKTDSPPPWLREFMYGCWNPSCPGRIQMFWIRLAME
jgi:hypothetical protein